MTSYSRSVRAALCAAAGTCWHAHHGMLALQLQHPMSTWSKSLSRARGKVSQPPSVLINQCKKSSSIVCMHAWHGGVHRGMFFFSDKVWLWCRLDWSRLRWLATKEPQVAPLLARATCAACISQLGKVIGLGRHDYGPCPAG